MRAIKAVNPKVQIDVVVCDSPAEFRDKVRDAEVVFGDLDAQSLAVASKLKWMQSREAGVEKMDPAVRASPIVVTNYQRTFAHGITETGMGMLSA